MSLEFKPMIRNNISLSVNPLGIEQEVMNQINYIKSKGHYDGPKKVLIIGASSSYGLASRISLAFGAGADTIGLSYEKGPRSEKALGTAGWYNNIFFKREAEKEGLIAKNIIADAFSKETKEKTIEYIKDEFGGKIDLVIYSLAAGRRRDDETGKTYTSVIKSIGEPVIGWNTDFSTDTLFQQTVEPASEQEIEDTVKVMGGEDWYKWMEALKEANVLSQGAKTILYSYIGSDLTHAFYHHGTLGVAKADCDAKAKEINHLLEDINGEALISVSKAVTTKASAVIPLFTFYCIGLIKVMKEKGTYEVPIQHKDRLFRDWIYGDVTPVIDEEGRIRIDSWEMDPDTQARTKALLQKVNEDNFNTDLTEYKTLKREFLNLSGFEVEGYQPREVTIDELKALEP